MGRCSTNKTAGHVEVFESVAQLPSDWNDHLPEKHFLRTEALLAHEKAELPHIKAIYSGIRKDGKWLGRASFQIVAIQPEYLNPTTLKSWQRMLWNAFTKNVRPKLLVAGQLFRHDVQSFYWQRNIPPFEAFSFFRDIIDAVAKQCAIQAILVKETPAAFVPYFLHHSPEYLMLRNDSSMKLRLPGDWQTLTDYEKSLKHKYAQRLRKVRLSWAGLEVKELNAEEVRHYATTIYELYDQVTHNQSVRLGMLSQNFLPALKDFYGDKLKVWGIFEAGKMIAFASAWVQDNSFDMFYIGFDYARNTELNLYFNILFFSIEQAILLRKPQLILGRTALEAKARVGCTPEYLHTFLFIKNAVVRRIVARLQQRFTEGGGEWENRHPFKKELIY